MKPSAIPRLNVSCRLEAYSAMMQEYIDAILEDREPSVTGKDGRAAVELCLAGLQSAREEIPVQLRS